MRIERRREVEASSGAHFTGEQSDNGQAHPLTEAKGLDELPLGVLERESDRIYRGDRHRAPQPLGLISKVLRSGIQRKSI